MNDDLMTPDEVCALLKVTKDWLYDQVQARRIPHVRLGRHLRFSRSEVLDYVRVNSVVTQEAEPGRAQLADGSAPTSSGRSPVRRPRPHVTPAAGPHDVRDPLPPHPERPADATRHRGPGTTFAGPFLDQ